MLIAGTVAVGSSSPVEAQEIIGTPIPLGETIIGEVPFYGEIVGQSIPSFQGSSLYTPPVGEVIIGAPFYPTEIPADASIGVGSSVVSTAPVESETRIASAKFELGPSLSIEGVSSKRVSKNQTRETIRQYWSKLSAQGKPAQYPGIRFHASNQVGEIGKGISSQSLSMVRQVDEDEYLIRVVPKGSKRTTVFLFRRFDFSGIPEGASVPTPGLCEVTGTTKYKDETGKYRSARVVEPVVASSLDPPEDILDSSARNDLKIASASAGSSITESRIPDATPSDSASPSSIIEHQPKFTVRRWTSNDGQHSAMGRLLGVGDEVIWLKLNTGSVVRMKLSDLSDKDRNHAISKRRDILEYRRLKKQLEASVQR